MLHSNICRPLIDHKMQIAPPCMLIFSHLHPQEHLRAVTSTSCTYTWELLENGTSELMSTEEWVFVNHFKTHKFLFVVCAFKFYFNAHKNCSYENWSFWFTSLVLTLGRQRVLLQSHSEVWRETLPQRYILKRKHKIKMKWHLSMECLVILCNAKQGLHELNKELTRVCKTNKS